MLIGTYDGVTQHYHKDTVPVLIMGPAGSDYIGTVIISHGFSANIGVMRPMGLALAKNGYRVVLYDLPGHGNSDLTLNSSNLESTHEEVIDRYGGNDYSLAGHSLGTLPAMKYGMSRDARSVIAISPIFSQVNRTSPDNLLIILAEGDPASIKGSASDAMINGTGSESNPGVLYGNHSNGDARMLLNVPGTDHITVIFNTGTFTEIVEWLDQSYGVDGSVSVTAPGQPYIWFLLCLLTSAIAFFPVSYLLLDHYRDKKYKFLLSAPHAWKPIFTIALSSLIATALVYFYIPLSFTGMAVADYIVSFLLYCGTAGLIVYLALNRFKFPARYPADALIRPASLALLLIIYLIVAIGVPASLSVFDLIPDEKRLIYMVLFTALTLPYSLLNEYLFRGLDGIKSPLLGMLGRALVIAALLAGAIISGQGFIWVTLPILAPLFILLEVITYYMYRWSGSPLSGVFLNSLIIAWLLASSMPFLS